MVLSSDLISQFAKITKDEKKTSTEKTVYGTVVESDGTKYVQFDGSDLLTPAIMTVDAEAGERVSVLLKNHTATVTGNISSPAARTEAVKIIAEDLSGIQLDVGNLVLLETFDAAVERIVNLEEEIERVDTLETSVAAATWELLWENSAPTNSFDAQTISLDLSDYHLFLVFAKASTTDQTGEASGIIRMDSSANLTTFAASAFYRRQFSISSTGVTVTAATINSYGSDTSTTNATWLIPYKIYGVKSGGDSE